MLLALSTYLGLRVFIQNIISQRQGCGSKIVRQLVNRCNLCVT